MIDDALVSRARAAADVVRPLSAQIEAGRRLPDEAVGALVASGAFKLLVPGLYGGAEASAVTWLHTLFEIAIADASTAWIAMIGGTSGLMSVYLDDDVARDVYTPAHAMTSGVFAPMGRAVAVEGGHRVTGRWPFSSGCELASHRMGGALVVGDTPRLLASGAPDVTSFLFLRDETRVVDTWDTLGLRGTGSHDVVADDVFVPTNRSFSLLSQAPRFTEGVYRVPFFGLLAAGVAAVTLGIARRAIDEITTLAQTKRPAGSKRGLAHRELVQRDIAHATGRLLAGWAFLREAAETCQRDGGSLTARATLRLAAAHAAAEAKAVVDLMHEVAAGTSIHRASPLERCLRDVHTATAHVMVGTTVTTLAGRILLGVESDTTTL